MKKTLLIAFILFTGLALFAQKRIAPKKTANEILNDSYCTGLFSSPDGVYFDLLDNSPIAGYANILDWLQGRVAGLQVFTLGNLDRVPYIRNQRAAIYVDEIRRDPGSLSGLPVTDIAMIKIIKGPFLGGFGETGGVISIYTIGTEDEETDE